MRGGRALVGVGGGGGGGGVRHRISAESQERVELLIIGEERNLCAKNQLKSRI